MLNKGQNALLPLSAHCRGGIPPNEIDATVHASPLERPPLLVLRLIQLYGGIQPYDHIATDTTGAGDEDEAAPALK